MKSARRVGLLVAFGYMVLSGYMQTVVVEVPTGPGLPGFQDLTVKILGNVSNGPPLPPLVSVGTGPSVFVQSPWGPRAYTSTGKFVNFAFRGFVGSADQPMIGGFVIGEGGRVVLIRAIGPSLATFGIG